MLLKCLLTKNTFVLHMDEIAGCFTGGQQLPRGSDVAVDSTVTERRDFLVLVIHDITVLVRRRTRVYAAIAVNQFRYQNGRPWPVGACKSSG